MTTAQTPLWRHVVRLGRQPFLPLPTARHLLFRATSCMRAWCVTGCAVRPYGRAWVRGQAPGVPPPPPALAIRCWALESWPTPLKFLGPAPVAAVAAAHALGAPAVDSAADVSLPAQLFPLAYVCMI